MLPSLQTFAQVRGSQPVVRVPHWWYANVFQVVREELPFFHKNLDLQLSRLRIGFVSK